METTIKTKTVSEKCAEYLEIILGVPVDSKKLKFNTEKRQVIIDDSQLFHQIAQSSGLAELRKGQSSTWYPLNVQDEFREREDYQWMVTLPSRLNQDFLRNFGGHYKFR